VHACSGIVSHIQHARKMDWVQGVEPCTGSRMTSIVNGHSKLSATSFRAIAAGALAGSSDAGLGVGTWHGSRPAGCCDGCAGACCCCGCCCCCGGGDSGGDGCLGCVCICMGGGWLAGVGACAGGGGWGCDAAVACPASHRTRSTCFLLLLCVCKVAQSQASGQVRAADTLPAADNTDNTRAWLRLGTTRQPSYSTSTVLHTAWSADMQRGVTAELTLRTLHECRRNTLKWPNEGHFTPHTTHANSPMASHMKLCSGLCKQQVHPQ
jgi:hypothetical protein